MQKIILKIEQENLDILENEKVECFLLSGAFPDEFVEQVMKKAEKLEKIVLAESLESFLKWKKFALDGLIVDLSKSENINADIKKVREEAGKDVFLGVVSRSRRHEAMIVSENEPDFVIFKVWKDGFASVKELVDWYAEFFLIQQAALLMDEDVEISELASDIIILNEKNIRF
ncbi:MAG: hypothetical protein ACK5N8_08440 [Alphaproteobacteria bacterium]